MADVATPAAPEAPREAGPDAAADASDASPAAPARRGRRRIVAALAIVACVGVLISTIAVWANRTLTNTDRWVATVAPLAEDPAVIDATANAVSERVVALIDVPRIAEESLPAQAQVLVVPLESAVQGFVADAVTRVLETDAFATLWEQANRVAHGAVMRVLRGEERGLFVTADGSVTLNLLPLISRVLVFIDEQAPNLIDNPVPFPTITADEDPDEAARALGAALGRTLRPGFGQITVFESDQLAAAQDALVLFDRTVYAVVAVTVLLMIAAIVLSPDRRRTVIVLAMGIVVAMVLATVGIRLLQQQVVGLIGAPEARAAARALLSNLFDSLRFSVRLLLAVGLALAVVAFLVGDSRLAVSARAGARRLVGGRRSATPSPAFPFVDRFATQLHLAGAGLAMLVLFFGVDSWGGLFATLGLLAAYELLVLAILQSGKPPAPAPG